MGTIKDECLPFGRTPSPTPLDFTSMGLIQVSEYEAQPRDCPPYPNNQQPHPVVDLDEVVREYHNYKWKLSGGELPKSQNIHDNNNSLDSLTLYEQSVWSLEAEATSGLALPLSSLETIRRFENRSQ